MEQGLVELDRDVNDYLVSWKLPDSPLTEDTPVTLRRLLRHEAGLTVHGCPGYAEGEAVPRLVDILDGVAPVKTGPVRVDAKPGSLWRYSGGG